MTDCSLTAGDFTPHVGKAFTPLGQHRTITLASVEFGMFAGADILPRAPFSLLFSGPPNDVLPEGLYDVAIHTYDRNRQDYQAVFN
jgi:hypothetical protein